MPEGQQWYNAPQGGGKKKGKNTGKNPSGKPVRSNNGNAPLNGAPVKGAPVKGTPMKNAPAKGAPVKGAPVKNAPANSAPVKGAPVKGTPVKGAPVKGTPVKGIKKPVNPQNAGHIIPENDPLKVRQQNKPGTKPVNRKAQMNGKKRVNPANGKPMPQGRPLNAQQNPNAKPAGNRQDIGKKRPQPQKKSNLPYPEDYVAKNRAPENKAKPVNGKRKLTPEERKKKFERLAELEQAKIEGKTAARKNPSQRSAQNRAVRNGILGTIVVVAALLVLSFVVHHLYDYIAEKPRFAFVTMGTVEHSIGAKALVVRDEDVIITENAGDLVTQITEGSRVAKDQALAMVVPETMKSVVTDLRNVQSQISDVQQELILSGDVPEADTIYKKYNNNLANLMDSVRFDAMNGNLTNAASYGASINVVIEERESEMSKITFNDDRLRVLRDDEKKYQSQLQRDAAVINANKPGIVSFRLDGKEGEIEYSKFLNMPLNDIRKYINDSKSAITSDLFVKEGQGAVRIAQNESQYLTVNLSKNDAAMSDFAVGTKHDINVRSEGISIDDCEVVRCEEDSGGMLITFNTSRAVESLLDRRTVDIEIVINESSGMKTSVSSLMNVEYAPKGSSAFCVYFPQKAGASASSFEEGRMFNVNIVPNAGKPDENGQTPTRNTISIAGCTVIRTETLSDGGILVAFTTQNDFASLFRLSRLCPDGYTAGFIDSQSGLGTTTESIKVTKYTGMASLYTNNQGFVEEVRVIIQDNDREFAIIDRAGSSKVPDLNTVIITNPKTVKPGDKVD